MQTDVLAVRFEGVIQFGYSWAGEFKLFIHPGIDKAQLIKVMKEATEALEHGADMPTIHGEVNGR